MILLSHIQAPCGGATFSNPHKFITLTNPLPLFSNPATQKFITTRTLHLTLAKADTNLDSDSSSPPQTVFVAGQDVPLEGVIQFEKPATSPPFQKWGRVALLAGADVLALFLFATIGRYSHGLSVFDLDTLRTADPFIAGWFLGAYFLGGFGEDGRGMNGVSKGVIATAKSWAVGIPIGIVIRAATAGHLPNYGFVFVSLGSTAVLLVAFRALLYTLLPVDSSKKSDVYRRGSPFELFELLTSLVRRW